MADFLTYLITSLVTFIIGALLAPTPNVQNAKKGKLGDFQIPRIDEGTPVPLLWGRVRVRGPNILWYGDLSTRENRTRHSRFLVGPVYQTTSYAYSLGLHVALCLLTGSGATFRKIWFGECPAWEGEVAPSAVGDARRISIRNLNLFGGEDRGGGVDGTVELYAGEWDQGASAYLTRKYAEQNADPANNRPDYEPIENFNYKGLVRMVFESFEIGERTVIPNLSVEIEQQPELLGVGGFNGTATRDSEGALTGVTLLNKEYAALGADGNPVQLPEGERNTAVSQVNSSPERMASIAAAYGDANPAEVLYDILVNDWGRLGLNPGLVDINSFRIAAIRLRDEVHGLSLKVESPNDAREIIQEILQQINGALYEAPDTRRIVLRLIRREDALVGDTEAIRSDLPTFDESNILEVVSFTTSNWNDTYNQTRVTYPDRSDDYKERSIIMQDLSNIEFQGRVRSTDFNYPGVSNSDLASRLATRHLFSLGAPISQCRLLLNREGAELRPGDVIRFRWRPYDIGEPDNPNTGLILRVQKIDLGALDSGRVAADFVQDPYFNNSTIFAAPGRSRFISPSFAVERISQYKIIETPLFFREDNAARLNEDSLTYFVVKPDGITTHFAVKHGPGADASLADSTTGLLQETNPQIGSGIYQGTGTGARLSAPIPITGNADVVFSSNDTLANLGLVGDESETAADAQAAIRRGERVFMIDDEIMAYERASQTGNTITLTGVHRALLDTVRAEHAIGDHLWFFGVAGFPLEDRTHSSNTGSVRNRDAAGETIRLAPDSPFISLDFTSSPAIHIPKRSRSARPLPPIIYKAPRGSSSPIFTVDTERVYRETKARLRQGLASFYNVFNDSSNSFAVGARRDDSIFIESDYLTAANRPSISSPFPLAVGCWTRIGGTYYRAARVIDERIVDSVSFELEVRLDLHQTSVDAILNTSGPAEVVFRFYAYNHDRAYPLFGRVEDLEPCTRSDIDAIIASPDVSLYGEEVTVIYE